MWHIWEYKKPQGNPKEPFISVAIVTSPACGGNAVADEYMVIDLRSMQKRNRSYKQAKTLR
jgi:hypothetical protein